MRFTIKEMDLPGGLGSKNLPAMQDIQVDPWVRKIP